MDEDTQSRSEFFTDPVFLMSDVGKNNIRDGERTVSCSKTFVTSIAPVLCACWQQQQGQGAAIKSSLLDEIIIKGQERNEKTSQCCVRIDHVTYGWCL